MSCLRLQAAANPAADEAMAAAPNAIVAMAAMDAGGATSADATAPELGLPNESEHGDVSMDGQSTEGAAVSEDWDGASAMALSEVQTLCALR